MGGSISKHGDKEAEWTWVHDSRFVQALQDKVKMTDNSMTSLANSIDAMHATAGCLTRLLKTSQSESLDVAANTAQLSSNLDDRHMALQLLLQIEKGVIHDKQCVLKSLQEILHLIKTTVQENSNTNVFHDFSIDKYLKMPDAKKCIPVYDERIATMERDTKLIMNENNKLRVDNTYKKNLEKEKQTLTEIRVNLEDRIKLLAQINTKHENKLKELTANEITLHTDIAKHKHMVESLKGQNRELKNKNKSIEKERDSLAMECDSIIEKIREQNVETITDSTVEDETNATKEKGLMSVLNQLDETYGHMKKMYEIETSKHRSSKYDLEKQKEVIEAKARENKDMEIELQTAKEEMKVLIATNTEHARQKNDLRLQLDSIKSENISLNERITHELEENISINLLKDNDISEKNREIDDLRQDNTELHHSIAEAKTAFNMDIKSCHFNIKHLKDECSTVKKELKSLTLIKKDQEVAIEQLRTEQKQRITNEGIMQQRKTVLENQLSKLKQESEQLQADYVRASDIINSLESSNQNVVQENERMKQELERMKRKKLFQVQVYYQRRGGLMMTVEDNLVQLLRSKMESDTVELEFIKCKKSADIQLDKPLLLLCISASRIGSDAANAIQGVTLMSNMSLLIFHHKDEHALPNQASYQVLTGHEYKILGGIYDLAFLTERGIYSCAMNVNNINSVANFISTEDVRKPTDNQ